MTAYIVKRVMMMIPTLLGITIVVFGISRLAPGEPAGLSPGAGQLEAGRYAALPEVRMRLHGLDKPVYLQYAAWLRRVVQFDFGDSTRYNRPVMDLIKQRLPVTITLNIVAFIIVYVISLPLGVLCAVRHGKSFDRAVTIILLALWSLPIMLTGQLLIGGFCGTSFLGWFPPAGLSSNNAQSLPFFPWLVDRLWHLVLPVICLAYTGLAYLTRQVKTAMLENLAADYITAARAKGLSESAVVLRHALRNSVIPLITLTAALLPAMLTGSVIVEKLFGIPGMGLLAFEAVAARDYNMVMAVATIAAVMNVLALLLADIAYAAADPRITFASPLQ